MFCNKCGTSLPDDSRFCNKCGNHIQPEKSSNEPDIDEYSICDVILVSYKQEDEQKIIKLLEEELKISSSRAYELLKKEPRIIQGEVVYAEALWLKSQLECFDTKVEI